MQTKNTATISDKTVLPIMKILYGPLVHEAQSAKVVIGPLVCDAPEVDGLNQLNKETQLRTEGF